jgi:transcriptional regulator with XRE-family HTH domain
MSVLAESPLAIRRLEAGLTRRELAARANVSEATIKFAERGGISEETLRRIARVLDMPASDLM